MLLGVSFAVMYRGSADKQPSTWGMPSNSGAKPPEPVAGNDHLPLPSSSLPLRTTASMLNQLAASGNAAAACRLAAEYQRCSEARAKIAFADRLARQSEVRGAREELGGEIVRLGQSGLESRLVHCDGVDTPTTREVVKHWRNAALAGNREAMMQYATGSMFDLGSLLQLLTELRNYKSEAERIARKAASDGDGRAVLALAAAYSPDSHAGSPPLLSQATGQDLVQALGLYMFAERSGVGAPQSTERMRAFIEEQISILKAAASPQQVATAEAEAIRLASEWSPPHLPPATEIAFLRGARLPPVKVNSCEL